MKPLKTIAMAALAASVAGIALTAQADERGGWGGGPGWHGFGAHHMVMGKMQRRGAERLFERFDVNGDGVVTQAEVDERVAARFAEADADSSGGVSLDEFKDHWIAQSRDRMVRGFQRLDRDGDGKVSRAEFDRISDRLFSRLDRDGNGELERVRPGQGPGQGQGMGQGPRQGQGPGQGMGQGMGQGPGQGRGPGMMRADDGDRDTAPRGRGGDGPRRGPGHGPGYGPMAGGMHGFGPGFGAGFGPGFGGIDELFERFDTDGDGKITRQEFDEVRGTLFASADSAGAGAFDLEGFAVLWRDMHDRAMVRMFQSLDADGDLSISSDEHAARTAGMVARMDRNGDGVLTKADLRGGPKGRDGRHHGKHEGKWHGKHHGDHHRGPSGDGPRWRDRSGD
ncbi:EF-hand domain-containing protein [Polymorphum gilvum]|uniref:EF hand domain protein n=1 Tax=Polymorphum gilvum (strain LMG 25793 / CGMCC 1.9160 / SL003B-26A1) TaxID=991905 RepID=F2IV92_POLGS|nr:EF-hand domain-containing protein [Polymorphum gilvum]ADZ71423.1 EF hand domain protein [Polymorphum gilvum SL003B-26A1]